MNNSEETEKIHIEETPKRPTDIEDLKKRLLSNEIADSETVSLGVNRKQFFIRLPTRLTDQLMLKKEDKVKVIWKKTPEKMDITLEVEKGA
jgi:hypothetical protein